MKKKKINKTRLKIFIALSLMFTLITTIFIGTKTFAYTTNTISSTLGNPTAYNNSTFLNENTYLTDGYMDFRVNNDSGYITYMTFDFLENNLPSSFANSNYIFIMNCAYLTQNGIFENTSSGQSVYLCQNASTYSIYNKSTQLRNYITKNNISYKCVVQALDVNTNFSTTSGVITIGYRGNQYQSSDSSWQGIRIYNIDILKSDELYTSSYISDIEEQYSQLLDDYDELQDDYNELYSEWSQLDDDFGELQDNYNELQSNYNTLENEYTDLQQDLENLTQTIDNGLWSYTSGVVAFGNGYGASYTTYDDIINANIIKDFTFDCIQTYPTYTQQNNGISGNVFIVMGVLPDENTSNWEEVKYTPANLLNFNINTNITNYIKITIDLTTINQAYQNKILQISKSNIELMNYEITSEKLEGLFDYEASYYRVERIKIEWTKESNDDYIYLISTNVNYTNGYTLGYYDGLNTIQYEKDTTINNQQQQINDLNNQVHELTLNVNTLTQQVDAFNSDYNLNNLMWTIASTPFESFKQIWDVKFFGVNVSELLLGLITTFIALNIAKRFFF